MEHIVQFAIGLDDNAIRERIEKRAEEHILKELTQDAKAVIYKRNAYSTGFSNEPTIFFNDKLDAFFKENEDKIIKMAAERLADRLSRTKKALDISKIEFEEAYDNTPFKEYTLYFIAPRDLVKDKYPEAEHSTISLELTTRTTMISPTKDGIDYDWSDIELDNDTMDRLIALYVLHKNRKENSDGNSKEM